MRYYGGKSKLLDFLGATVSKTGINHGSIFCDLFSDFSDENGMKIDSIRTRIQKWKENNVITEDEFYVLLTL